VSACLLSTALLHTLAAKGSLGQIKARIRSEIFSALDQSDDATPRPPLSNTNLLINELIREYLAFNQYRYSLNVFLPESNQPEVPPFDRNFISQELHVQENQHSVQMSVAQTGDMRMRHVQLWICLILTVCRSFRRRLVRSSTQ
jgi:lisH domain-containing protein FOPNL